MYDIVADCSDNVPTRYLVNDACVLSGKPLVSASALRMEGQVISILFHGTSMAYPITEKKQMTISDFVIY